MATEVMPLSRAARMTRTAISPRLAMRTLVMRGIIIQPIGRGRGRFWRELTKRMRDLCRCLQLAVPEVGPRDIKFEQQFPHEREREPDHGVRIAANLADECPAEAVDRE